MTRPYFLKSGCLLLVSALALFPNTSSAITKLTGRGVVTATKSPAGVQLLRDGTPYYIKGICGQDHLDLAAQIGANSTRTYGSQNAASILTRAQNVGMTVTLGLWLEHKASAYKDDAYKTRMRQEVKALVTAAKDHPATLLYSLGNETNSGADTPEAWAFINELAETIHKLDPNHPVMTVLAGSKVETLNNVAKHAPSLDLMGINAYGGISIAPRDLESSDFKGPYLITEWGPLGHWEVAKTSWGAPIEPNSDQKAQTYRKSFALITSNKARCLGSYVFLWGQKEERTPTWYSMFVENRAESGLHGEACPTVDVMAAVWSGKALPNSSPYFQSIKINGETSFRDVTIAPNGKFTVELTAADPDRDPLTYVWEVLAEAVQLGEGGSKEDRPPQIANAVKTTTPGSAEISVSAPGKYRVYVYVLDGKGHSATLNIPFLVK